MPVSFEKEYPEAFKVYLDVMTDPLTQRGLSIKDIVDLGYARCLAKDLAPTEENRELKSGTSGYEWARKNKPFMTLYNLYINKGNEPQDQPFSMGMLNDQFQGLITTDKQFLTVTQAMNEMNSLHITPTVRHIKWISRFSFTPDIAEDRSFLRTIGLGAIGKVNQSTGKILTSFTLGATDIGLIYAQKEKEAVANKLDTRWDSRDLDISFFMPVSAQMELKKEPLSYVLPYGGGLTKMIGELNKERYEKKLFTGEDDADFRDRIWSSINEAKKEKK